MALVSSHLSSERPAGIPSEELQAFVDALVEASVPAIYRAASGSYAIDWTDFESFFRPQTSTRGGADGEASWGHRASDAPGSSDELFFGWYLLLMTMVRDEAGPAVPELIRRMCLTTCSIDPVAALVEVVVATAASGVDVRVVLADCGYSHRVPAHFAYPLRAIGAGLVFDLHPSDRGTKGTYAGATLYNGNLYCPSTPAGLFGIGPLSRGASTEETEAHDRAVLELSCYKLGRLSADDSDGYHRVGCPAVAGKCRCPLRPDSMGLSYERPEILSPPQLETAPRCCVNKSITVPPQVNAKTRQRHDYQSASHRRSYARRTAVERSNSMLKSPAGININMKGWCELAGVAPLSLFLACACACVVVNFALVDAFEARQEREATRPSGQIVRRPERRAPRTVVSAPSQSRPTSSVTTRAAG